MKFLKTEQGIRQAIKKRRLRRNSADYLSEAGISGSIALVMAFGIYWINQPDNATRDKNGTTIFMVVSILITVVGLFRLDISRKLHSVYSNLAINDKIKLIHRLKEKLGLTIKEASGNYFSLVQDKFIVSYEIVILADDSGFYINVLDESALNSWDITGSLKRKSKEITRTLSEILEETR